MNLKFFILGLYVLVTIAQANAKPDTSINAQMNDEDKAEAGKTKPEETIQKPIKRQTHQMSGRRFNPLEAIGNIAKQPMEYALKEAMDKLFKSYSDPTKPFGPTYDTTYESGPSPAEAEAAGTTSNRRMNLDDDPTREAQNANPNANYPKQPEEVRMSTMIQPPPGQSGYYTYEIQKRPGQQQQPPPGQSGYYSYEGLNTRGPPPNPQEIRMSTMIQPPPGYPQYYTYEIKKIPIQPPSGQTSRSFGHSLEPTLPYQAQYDSTINGRQTVFQGPPPGYFPHGQQPGGNSQYFMRRSNPTKLDSQIQGIVRNSPAEIEKLIAEITASSKSKGRDEIAMRNGFLGDVFEKSSEEKSSSGEVFSNTKAEFSNPNVAVGNRRFSETAETQEFSGLVEKLLSTSLRGIAVVLSYLFAIVETGTMDQIGEIIVRMYEVLQDTRTSLNT